MALSIWIVLEEANMGRTPFPPLRCLNLLCEVVVTGPVKASASDEL